ncbi:LacI family transcriptional regulator [Arthrobacter ulcerisalmonis]|nr:LacI family DNA-binding transcriptional regulator [Arthrobacter ulcerisalmonis]MDQ0664655.1 LacI family transcriptional regulator [Arthrobacter ulcerisalmonis]
MAESGKVRLRDVADRARVSTTTASLVLSGRAEEFRIAMDTRDSVLAVAERLGYVRARTSRRRSQGTTPPSWTIFTPSDIDSGPLQLFLRGAQGYVEEKKLQVDCLVVPFERGRLREKQRWISASHTRGAIMVGLTDDDVSFVDGADFDIPVVIYNRHALGCASVVVDDYGAGQQVMRHFLARGLSRFVLVSPPHASRSLSMRTVGFTDALRQAPGDHDMGAVQHVAADVNDAAAFGEALDRLDLSPGRLGVFVLNDQMIGAVMAWAQNKGLLAPDDLELVSYGDSSINRVMRPSVSSVSVPIEEMSVECARTLHQAVAHPGTMSDVARSFPTRLVTRETSPAV